MSAHTMGRPEQVQLKSAVDQIESFLTAAKELESSLSREKLRNQKLREELQRAQAAYNRVVHDTRAGNEAIRKLEGELAKDRKDLGQCQEELAKAKGAHDQLVQENQRLAQGHQAQIHQLQQELQLQAGKLKAALIELDREREMGRKLQAELSRAMSAYDRAVKDAEMKDRELALAQRQYEMIKSQTDSQDSQLKRQLQFIESERNKLHRELKQYQSAWSGVLEREREAKEIIAEGEGFRKSAEELGARVSQKEQELKQECQAREQAERHAKSYQLELQNALVRLHSAETKFTEISREIQALNELRRAGRESEQASKTEVAQLREALARSRQDVIEAQTQSRALERRLTELQDQMKDLAAASSALKAELQRADESQDQIDLLKAELLRAREELQAQNVRKMPRREHSQGAEKIPEC